MLTIRRAAVTLCSPSVDEHHLVGTVTDVAFRDRGYEHAVDVAGAAMITGVLGRDRVGRGETVGLRFEPSGCYVFPSDGGLTSAPQPLAEQGPLTPGTTTSEILR